KLGGGAARYPAPDWQWIEDRFWIWVHYGAAKIGRGELFEALDMIASLRSRVLGPLALAEAKSQPNGVRKIERRARERSVGMRETVTRYEAGDIARALRAAADLYRDLRRWEAPVDL